MTAVYKYRYWLIGGAVVLVMGLFIGLSAANSGPGFPLDDGWIHQTYARNLARNGRFEFIPGIVSAGSTSPLWTILLAIGYLLRLPYLLWAYLLGGLSLWLLAWAGMRLWRQLWPDFTWQDWLVGLVLVLTWPLVWAAASGMETLLFAALGLVLVGEFASDKWQVAGGKSLILLGFLSGLLILVRPDGLVLLLLLGVGLFLGAGTMKQRVKRAAMFGGTAVLPLLPYFTFNLWSSGSVWPNTFYAKQIEYATLLAQPLVSRLARLLFFSLGGPENGWRGVSGAHLLLLPGLVTAVTPSLRTDWQKKQLVHLLPLLWAGGHVVLYAWRLPVTYQHGRYLLAALPVWILYGLAGWFWLLNQIQDKRVAFLSRQVSSLTFGILLLFFLLLGGQSYAQDVAFIQGEMVTVAHWLAENTPPDALIAAHDIGAIGYFAERPLLDLAGLVTPAIIPYLDDEAKIGRYIQDSQAHYLVTAPGWPYNQIIDKLSITKIYTTHYLWTQQNGLNNMTVYQINLP
ncbi:MAG: hypothetical protein H6667_24755 [Ardenticatenaceae bacterium]|nr:hypothetical protein [Ardenticatenaceae bacterium]MCB9446350.1 hypothetical protein [Ardenticatenaceae bacterium]